MQSLRTELAEAEAQIVAEKNLRSELVEEHSDASLLGAARKLLTGDELDEALRVPSLGAIGKAAGSVGDLGARRKAGMGRWL